MPTLPDYTAQSGNTYKGNIDENVALNAPIKGADLTSASPLVIGTDGNYFVVTGSTNFAAMTVAADRNFTLAFTGTPTITVGSGITLNNAGSNYTMAAGDIIECQSTAADTVTGRIIKADGTAVVSLSDEEIQDIAGPLVASGGTKTGITITYQDGSNDMDFVVDNATALGNLSGTNTGDEPSGPASVQVFISNDTWTRPADVKTIVVEVLGAGGGGAGTATTSGSGGGGGGGGGLTREIIDVTAISSVAVTIGPAGTAGNLSGSGGDGGTSSFGAHSSADGGAGGRAGSGPSNKGRGGNGGTAAGGDINISGSPGGNGSLGIDDVASGAGGASGYGGGGAEARSVDLDGVDAPSHGSGGGGGHTTDGTGNPGGAGAAGAVFIWEYK